MCQPGEMAVCVQCNRRYVPSSGHAACPACRSRDTCACGRPKQRASRTCAACRRHAGADNGAWKGGKVIHKAGYVMVYAPWHPRARKRPYVFEHILVMEAMLGRYLEPVRERAPPKRHPRRQSARESRALDPTATKRHPSTRRRRMGANDPRSLQRPSRRNLISSLHRNGSRGGEGIRTLVSGRPTGTSSGGADAQISPVGVHRQRTSGPVRMRCSPPASEQNRRGKPAQVILGPRPQAHGASSYLETRQRARTRRWRLCLSGV